MDGSRETGTPAGLFGSLATEIARSLLEAEDPRLRPLKPNRKPGFR
jgi:hypothetical protein